MTLQKLIEKYLDTEAYGANLILKESLGFPKFLPLPCHVEHGWTALPNALVTDLNIAKNKGLMFVYSKRRELAWKKVSDIPVLISGPPFVIYRKMKGIRKKKNACGTIVFPSHSTIFIESRFDIDKFCEVLKKLPEKFKPITVCLLYPDIKRGRDKIYEKHGFSVVSAGEKVRGSIDFVKNYYDILSSHKFATSNEIGTYTFYAIEMGIPFFLSGEEPTVINVGNKDPNIAPSGKMSDHELGKKSNQLFGHRPSSEISEEQRKFVLYEFGVDDAAGLDKLKKGLWQNTKNVSYWVYKVPMYFVMSSIKFLIPQKLAYFVFERLNKK